MRMRTSGVSSSTTSDDGDTTHGIRVAFTNKTTSALMRINEGDTVSCQECGHTARFSAE